MRLGRPADKRQAFARWRSDSYEGRKKARNHMINPKDGVGSRPKRQTPEFNEYIAQGGRVMDWYAIAQSNAAREGNTEAAMQILKDFVGAINQYRETTWNGPIHWEYARYIADAFAEIVKGSKADLALGVKSSKAGRRKGTKVWDEDALCAAYYFLLRRGLRPEKAIAALNEQLGADRRTIQRVANPHPRAPFKHAFAYPGLIDDETLKVSFAPYAAEIARILAADG